MDLMINKNVFDNRFYLKLQTKQKNFETEREELRKIGAASKSLAEPAGIVYHGKPLLIR
jgi:hypothetical protein